MKILDKYTGTTCCEVEGIPVIIEHKKVKRMNMRIRSDGTVYVSLPVGVSSSEAATWVRTKKSWILDGLRKQSVRQASGKSVREYSEADRRNLKSRIERILPQVEARTGLFCNGWTVRRMTSRWGSCNTRTHHINLSMMLCDQPDEVLEYVIVHELVHTRVANHGPEFKAYMDRLMPGWRTIRKEMRG